jgi:hypothetical protein
MPLHPVFRPCGEDGGNVSRVVTAQESSKHFLACCRSKIILNPPPPPPDEDLVPGADKGKGDKGKGDKGKGDKGKGKGKAKEDVEAPVEVCDTLCGAVFFTPM